MGSATTTTTSTTSTTTTTTRTTYKDEVPAVPCADLCTRIPVENCSGFLEPGGFCQSSILGNPCVKPSMLTFTCPAWNNDTTRQPDVAGNLEAVRCSICNLELISNKDQDPGNGTMIIDISFGPNMIDGLV